MQHNAIINNTALYTTQLQQFLLQLVLFSFHNFIFCCNFSDKSE